MYPTPNPDNNLYNILKKLPKEKIKDVFDKRNMSYTKVETSKNISLFDKVHRELLNLQKSRDVFYNIVDLIDFVYYVFLNNGDVKITDIKSKYGNDCINKIELLEKYGVVFIIEDRAILPTEYFFVLADEHINKRHKIDDDTLIKGIYMYKNDEIPCTISYLNKNFNTFYDTGKSKLYCDAMVYDFVMKNHKEVYGMLSERQKEMIDFVIEKDNKVKVRDFIEKFSSGKDDRWWDPFLHDIIEDRTKSDLHSDMQKLFFTGFFIPIGDIYNNLNYIAVPKEVYETTSKRFNEKINSEKDKIISGMLSETPKNFFTNLVIAENLRKFLIAVMSLHPKINADKTPSKKAYSEISNITGFSQEWMEFFFVLCLENNWIDANILQGDIAAINECGKKLLSRNKNVIEKEIIESGLNTRSWNEFYVKANQYGKMSMNWEDDTFKFNVELKKIILKKLNNFQDVWLSADSFLSYLKLDRDFRNIELLWDRGKSSENPRYHFTHYHSFEARLRDHYDSEELTKKPSRYETFKDGVNKIYATLFMLGAVDLVTDGDKITKIKLSALGKSFNEGIKNTEKQVSENDGRTDKHDKHRLIVQPNNEVFISMEADIGIIETLSKFANPKKIDKFCIYEITKDSIMQAISWGFEHKSITNFLKANTDKEIPAALYLLIEDRSSKYGEIEIKECGGCLIFKDEILMKEILSDKSIAEAVMGDGGENKNVVLVKDNEKLNEIYKRLKAKGYGVKR